MATAGAKTPHPYYPQDLILDHYVANTNTVFHTLVYVSIGFFAVLALACLLGYPRRHSTLGPLGEKVTFFWFILCASLHLGFEGYYDIYHVTLAGDNSPVAQVWKEYALSDSRYLTSDSFVRVVEAITTVSPPPPLLSSSFYIRRSFLFLLTNVKWTILTRPKSRLHFSLFFLLFSFLYLNALVGVGSLISVLCMVPLPQPTLPPYRPTDAFPGSHLWLHTLLCDFHL
jgi:hypothetical protein